MEFTCYSAWEQLPDSADRLFAQAERESIFFSRAWFEHLATHGLEAGYSVLLACVIDADRVLAILPLMTREPGHLDALGHLYSSLYGPLLARRDRAAILACLAAGLDRLAVQSLRLVPVAGDDTRLDELQAGMQRHGYTCHRHFRFFNWTHRTHGQSFDDYMAARPSRVRSTIARKSRKLEREHGYAIRLYTGPELARGVADYNTVYRASWKANELFGEFVDALAQRLAGQGWLRLGVLYVAGQPVAAQFWFVAHARASIFKLVYDEAWKRYSPGSILTAYLMRQVIDVDRVDEIDFLTGNDAYKQDWMSERRERWGLYCAKPRQAQGRVRRFVDTLTAGMARIRRSTAGSHLCPGWRVCRRSQTDS